MFNWAWFTKNSYERLYEFVFSTLLSNKSCITTRLNRSLRPSSILSISAMFCNLSRLKFICKSYPEISIIVSWVSSVCTARILRSERVLNTTSGSSPIDCACCFSSSVTIFYILKWTRDFSVLVITILPSSMPEALRILWEHTIATLVVAVTSASASWASSSSIPNFSAMISNL